MKVLIDMNLSPSWVQALEDQGFEALHWSSVGNGRAPDSVVLAWAKDNGYIVFTNDLDFGAILAITRAAAPSVIQVRTQDLSPGRLIDLVVRGLRQHQSALERGLRHLNFAKEQHDDHQDQYRTG
jgi:predicted nuclease of predicted toxin-antitoxin system